MLKACAAGASAVGIGRPALWGLALGGERGVLAVLDIPRRTFYKRAPSLREHLPQASTFLAWQVLDILADEAERALSLLGVSAPSELGGAGVVVTRPAVTAAAPRGASSARRPWA